jgi:GT2 family glycosyltransferase
LFVFSWTDQWYRGGQEIIDWQFGLTDRMRRPKPALAAVSRAFAEMSSPGKQTRPKVSVVVCTYNGARTLDQCLRGVDRLDYPDYEVIVVDDGSTDDSSDIARRFDVRLIQTENLGLSNARNVGLRAASGEIVAYIDDDAYPDEDWLTYLVEAFDRSEHAGVGGPNLPPPSDPPLADCVAHAPGGPTHVLLSDTLAEHIPGCNMAFRRDRLLEVGGFDAQFRIAGDDVDICWRMHERGWTLGFSPSAVVWHHRRGSIRAYLRQQLNYGRAEAMLERKWPQKYNAAGHLIWSGRLYGKGYLGLAPWKRRRIYHGTWGTALFQSVYQATPSLIGSLPTMPEWYLLTMLLAATGLIGFVCAPLLWALPLAAVMCAATALTAVITGLHARIDQRRHTWSQRARYRSIVIMLHLAQPVARLIGRLHLGLTPWRLRGLRGFAVPRVHVCTHWSEQWHSPEQRLADVEAKLRIKGAVVVRGGDFDRWDLELRGGMCGAARLHMTVEEHGSGRQLARFRTWPRWCGMSLGLAAGLVVVAVAAALKGSAVLACVSAAPAVLLIAASLRESSAALATMQRALRTEDRE